MNSFPRIVSLATAVPSHRVDQDEAMAFGARFFDGAFTDLDRLLNVYGNAAIGSRYFCVPKSWYEQDHGMAERNQLYLDNAVALLEETTVESLDAANLAPQDIDMIVTVSTTGIATPSLDARLMEILPFRRDVQRLPIFGLGCAGGVLGLARAAALARAQPGDRVLFLVVELCSLTFRRADRSKSNLIGTALFGDGAAAAVLTSEGPGPAISAWGEHTWLNSLDIMGWDVADDGLGVLFSRDIPALVRERMQSATEDFLTSEGLDLHDIDDFVCHPGGAKVLDALEAVFGLPNGGLKQSRAILNEFGNMSAATVMFVLQRALDENKAKRYLMSSLGPGFSVAFLVLESA